MAVLFQITKQCLCCHLPDGLDTLPERAVDDDPGQEEAAGQLPPDRGEVTDPGREPQHLEAGHGD